MERDHAEPRVLDHPAWHRRRAPRVLIVILAIGALGGLLNLRMQDQLRKRCLNEYAVALTAADTARVDRMAFQQPRRRTIYCRSFRQPSVY